MEYARTLNKKRGPPAATGDASKVPPEDDATIEESWTFIGDDSDPELVKRIKDYDAKKRMSTTSLAERHLESRGLPVGESLEFKSPSQKAP